MSGDSTLDWLRQTSSTAIRSYRDTWRRSGPDHRRWDLPPAPDPYPFEALISLAKAREADQDKSCLELELAERESMYGLRP